MNLAEIALRPGRDPARADHPAFRDAAGAVSNAAFQAMVAALAADLAKLGIKPGDKIVFRMTNSAEFAAAFLACVWLGADPGPAELAAWPERAGAHRRLCRTRRCFSSPITCATMPATAGLRPDVKRMIVTGSGLVGMARMTATIVRLRPPPCPLRSTQAATRPPSSSSPPAPPGNPRAWSTPIAGSKRSAIQIAPACRRSRATSSLPPANGASSARSATMCCFRCATAPPARSWRIAPRPSASCRPSNATASRCCTRSPRSTAASSPRPASSTATTSPRCAAPTPPASRWRMPCARNGRRASAARSGSTTAFRKRRW